MQTEALRTDDDIYKMPFWVQKFVRSGGLPMTPAGRSHGARSFDELVEKVRHLNNDANTSYHVYIRKGFAYRLEEFKKKYCSSQKVA